MSLFARIKDAELLKHSLHELGTIFYTMDDKGNIEKVAYFSGSRIVLYEGEQLPEELARLIRNEGFQFKTLEFDEITKSLKVIQ